MINSSVIRCNVECVKSEIKLMKYLQNAHPFKSSMQTPNMQGLLEQPNEVAELASIIQNSVVTQQLINIKLHNLTSSDRRRQCNSVDIELVIVRRFRIDSQRCHLLLLWCDVESSEFCSSRILYLLPSLLFVLLLISFIIFK